MTKKMRKRRNLLQCRVSEAEKLEIDRRAESVHLDVSNYMRFTLLGEDSMEKCRKLKKYIREKVSHDTTALQNLLERRNTATKKSK